MKRLLIVDDDETFCAVLARKLGSATLQIETAHNGASALQKARIFAPDSALLDLTMPGMGGLELIPELLLLCPNIRIVMLTGYATIGTAVEAIKLGAVHYLAKPVGSEEILQAFQNASVPAPKPQSLYEAERQFVLSAYARNGQNISATARELGMHRRSLQRKLEKLL